MDKESDPKIAATKCLEEVGLDPESYRIGHTKARWVTPVVANQPHPTLFVKVTCLTLCKWCGSPEIPASSSAFRYIRFIWNIFVITCHVMMTVNTVEYLLVFFGCPRLRLSTCAIIWTPSDQASNHGLRSTPRSGEGKFSVPARQNAVCDRLSSLPTLCVQHSDETEQTNFTVIPGQFHFAVVPFLQASDITTSCYGMHSSILLVS